MTQAGYARPELLTETEWLEQHLDDPDIRIVDCDPFDVYRRAHSGPFVASVKGAVGIRVHHYIKQPEYPTDNRKYPLVAPPDTAKEVMESLGIGAGTKVVAYDSNGSLWAARLWWVLNYYGHTEVTVLNGGWKKWFDEGRPVTLDVPKPKAAAREGSSTPKRTRISCAPWNTGPPTSAIRTWCTSTCGPTVNGWAPPTGATSGSGAYRTRCTWNGSTFSRTTLTRPSRKRGSCGACWNRQGFHPTGKWSPIDRAASVRRTESSS